MKKNEENKTKARKSTEEVAQEERRLSVECGELIRKKTEKKYEKKNKI